MFISNIKKVGTDIYLLGNMAGATTKSIYKTDNNLNNLTPVVTYSNIMWMKLLVFNNKLYFVVIDTTSTNPVKIKEYDPLTDTTSDIISLNSSNPQDRFNFFDDGNNLFFISSGKLYKITSSTSATNLTPTLNIPDNIVYKANGKLYFGADDGTHGTELYEYDGSSVNLVKDINIGSGSSIPRHVTELNGDIIFQASPDGTNNKLFKLHNNTLTPLN